MAVRRWTYRRRRSRPHVLFVSPHHQKLFHPETDVVDDVALLFGEPLLVSGLGTYQMIHIPMPMRASDRGTTPLWSPGMIRMLQALQPDLVICCRLDWEDPPTEESCRAVGAWCQETGTPFLAVWTDLVTRSDVEASLRALEWIDVHVSIDRPRIPDGVPDPDRFLSTWSTQHPGWFYHPGNGARPIVVNFIGERTGRPERIAMLKPLKDSGLSFYEGGGRGEERLSMARYARIHRTSQMSINITSHPTCSHVKGRVFESIACGALLLEQANDATSQFLRPEVDYVPFTTGDELRDTVAYYQRYPARARSIAEAGHAVYQARYTPGHFWSRIFTRLWGSTWRT